MRNTIEYYYGIEVDEITFNQEKYYFNDYILIPIYREIDLNLYDYMNRINLNNYEIIINKEEKYITKINEKMYILLRKKNNYRLNFLSLEKNTIILNEEKIIPWDMMWEQKIDYYEKHVKTLSSQKINESFHYYIGLCENAISMYKKIKHEDRLYLSHLRLSNTEDYLNPINYIIDYRVRDVSEYVKKLFFSNKLNLNDIYLYIMRNNFSQHECALLFVRMLYPSYYFDAYDLVTNGESDSILDIYIEKIDDYESFLKWLYFLLKQYTDIPRIDWLIKKT